MSAGRERSISAPQRRRQVQVTDHACRRYLERIDATEPYPKATIREAWSIIRNKAKVGASLDEPLVLVYDVGHNGAAVILTVYDAGADGQSEVIRA